jgi:hypothetical protein
MSVLSNVEEVLRIGAPPDVLSNLCNSLQPTCVFVPSTIEDLLDGLR